MSTDVEFRNVSVTFGNFYAAKEVNVKINGGEFFSFLGPSGCGKTTLLRTVSGFLKPTEGQVLINGEDMVEYGPNERPTAMIFQKLALFPLMTASENIAFALEVRGVSKIEREKKAEELLDLIELSGQGNKKINELSGGQQQRVAIARALAVPDVKILLLDEPLSALDLKLRQKMRTELRAIQKRVNLTFIYITHDQGEALTMSDRVAVMNEGEIEQIGGCDEVYDSPNTPFVATFVGENNPFYGKVISNANGKIEVETDDMKIVSASNKNNLSSNEESIAFVRPESILIDNGKESFTNKFEATVNTLEFEGHLKHIFCTLSSGSKIKFSVANAVDTSDISEGSPVKLGFNEDKVVVLPTGKLAIDR